MAVSADSWYRISRIDGIGAGVLGAASRRPTLAVATGARVDTFIGLIWTLREV